MWIVALTVISINCMLVGAVTAPRVVKTQCDSKLGCACANQQTGKIEVDGVSVFCDGDTDGGGWLLLLSQNSVSNQYSGSKNPLTQELNVNTPSPDSQYSRNWGNLLGDPQPGAEFMIQRAHTGDFVRFVQSGKWCGWSNTKNCNHGDHQTGHPFFTTGNTYDKTGAEIVALDVRTARHQCDSWGCGGKTLKYFNGCALSGGCGGSSDGIGFGNLESHLRRPTSTGDHAYGGSAWGPALAWDTSGADTEVGGSKFYTYWYRAYTGPVKPVILDTGHPFYNSQKGR